MCDVPFVTARRADRRDENLKIIGECHKLLLVCYLKQSQCSAVHYATRADVTGGVHCQAPPIATFELSDVWTHMPWLCTFKLSICIVAVPGFDLTAV